MGTALCCSRYLSLERCANMLTRLSIRNVVLIEALDLDFAGGLGVLTGETGAGKSILLDALGFVLGCPGFPRQHVQARLKGKFQPVNDQHIADIKRTKHGNWR